MYFIVATLVSGGIATLIVVSVGKVMKQNYKAKHGEWPTGLTVATALHAPKAHVHLGLLIFSSLMELAIFFKTWTLWEQAVSPGYWMLLGALAFGFGLSVFTNFRQLKERSNDWSYMWK